MTALRLRAALLFVEAVPLTGTDSVLVQEQQNTPETEETGRTTEVENPGGDTDEPVEESEEAPRLTGLTEHVKVTAPRRTRPRAASARAWIDG